MGIIDNIEKEQSRREVNFEPGDTVRVSVRISEGDKERVQAFEGVVIGIKHGGSRASFTVRKVTYGVGVERIFPLNAPSVENIEVVASGRVRRAKLYFLRARSGKAARLRERELAGAAATGAGAEGVVTEPTPAEPSA